MVYCKEEYSENSAELHTECTPYTVKAVHAELIKALTKTKILLVLWDSTES